MSLKKIGLVCILCLCTCFIILGTFDDELYSQPSEFNLHPDLVPMLVLHNAHDGVSPASLHGFKHDHTFLLVKKKQGYHFLHSLNDLLPYDTDRDNIIDQADSIYGQLYLGSYDHKSHKFKYQPLCNTAIRAIKLVPNINKHTLDTAEAIIPTHHQQSPHYQLIITAELFKNTMDTHPIHFQP